ncbi:hypothetical protein DPMN_060644 [Dreissena polymorpha]|uniref:Uncharacterized protein n=1 Tax=Dreissena polymorpha TaxID=45954 RepID=A0A9D4C5K7_DREPO|nr:hypothetical protein DPMN_060644 [Dreissena polymorpha]
MSVEEPDTGPLAVNLTIVRTGGTLGVMTLEWVAMLGGRCEDWVTLGGHDLGMGRRAAR